MSDSKWCLLNDRFHAESHFSEGNPYNRNQRYFNQSLMLSLMVNSGVIKTGNWLDWGCGVGAVALLLKEQFNLTMMTYDKYYSPTVNQIDLGKLKPGKFDVVVNTAVFEHVRSRKTLDEIESYVRSSGCFAIHTLVPENIPKNPDWMYLLPVHCAFHTNKSMGILMEDWGYQCSVYNKDSKMWVLFRDNAECVEQVVNKLNSSLGWEYLHFKKGFVDYWK